MAENPPPAPPLPLEKFSLLTLEEFEKKEVIDFYSTHWAKNFPELKWTCCVHKICDDEPPRKCAYRIFKPLKQQGPTCGIVALSMALYNNAKVEDLLSEAKEMGYTINGEMFSALNLLKLLESNIHKGIFSTPKVTLHEGPLESSEIISFLFTGGAMLVPYDTWYNHAPCLARGHKAHWALVCGIIVPHGRMAKVLAWHGKSQRLAIWDLSDLSESNANLEEFSPARERDDKDYYMPPGGISGDMGLCGKSILIHGFKDDFFMVET